LKSQEGYVVKKNSAWDHLPLPPRDYLVLFALTGGPRHGYRLVMEVEAQSEGAVQLDPSNLYRLLRGLMGRGLVEDRGRKPTPEDPAARRRYFALSAGGQRVVAAEARRLARLTDAARSARLIPEVGR
jgi:DNA-binding PadR family transcriptional regulator